jgi:asparagine synthase (glutamine-hydrolysing)
VCGIAGIVRPDGARPVEEIALRRMARAIRHRGPDGFGLALGHSAGFASSRLAIFDIQHGWQPMQSADGGTLIVYNGEVFNHPELRAELARDGIATETTSDTEVVLRLLERDGLAALDKLNGQFAFAWWEPGPRRLTLVRDRFGIHPLHWSLLGDGTLVFGSEAKALFASGEVSAEPDLGGIDDVFETWAPRAPRTAFRGVQMLPPGQLLVWEAGRIVAERTWWKPDYSPRTEEAGDLEPLMRSSVELRLRADVPVGTYLSGGLDSSLTTALAKEASDHQLRTFSVAFKDPHFDERGFLLQVAGDLGTDHHVVDVGPEEIAGAFPDVVWHAETPLIRTAPVPLYLLAQATREQGITVVATGEGADELYWGYDLFKEVVARNAALAGAGGDGFNAADVFGELYPYFEATGAARGPAWARFFLEAGPADDPLFSHQTRVAATAGVKAFYAPDVAQLTAAEDRLEGLRASLPAEIASWSPLEKAAYLEVTTLLGPYLLGPQSDRVAMAHGVEARYPFLDHRVFEHSVRLAPERKLRGADDKIAVRDLARTVLPEGIAGRTKQPYRAPQAAPFFEGNPPEWVDELLSPALLRATGLFDETKVAGLVRRCRAGRATGYREGMALVGVLSTQVWHERFCGPHADVFPPEEGEPQVFIKQGIDQALERV